MKTRDPMEEKSAPRMKTAAPDGRNHRNSCPSLGMPAAEAATSDQRAAAATLALHFNVALGRYGEHACLYLLELRLFIPSISKIPPNNIEVGQKGSAEFRSSIVVVCYDPSHSGSPTLLGVAIISSIGGLRKQGTRLPAFRPTSRSQQRCSSDAASAGAASASGTSGGARGGGAASSAGAGASMAAIVACAGGRGAFKSGCGVYFGLWA